MKKGDYLVDIDNHHIIKVAKVLKKHNNDVFVKVLISTNTKVFPINKKVGFNLIDLTYYKIVKTKEEVFTELI
jgi:hypothetical protein